MKKSLLIIVFCLFANMGFSQLPKGDRTLAWQIDMAENNNYDSAFAFGYDACIESVHLFFKWTDLESDTAVFNSIFVNIFLDITDICYLPGFRFSRFKMPRKSGFIINPCILVRLFQ